MANEFAVVSLYTGAGGLDYGFEAAGFTTRVAVDMDKDSCATLRANRRWPVVEKDIVDVKSSELMEVAGLRRGEADVLIGGPPCQPFSKSAYWNNGDTMRLRDPRAGTLVEFMRCVRDVQPKVFLLENVHGIKYTGKEEGFLLLRELMENVNREKGTNYSMCWKVLSAADYGVPQLRRRFFLACHREGLGFVFPQGWHADRERDSGSEFRLDGVELEPYLTSWDAIGGLGDPAEDLSVRGKWADLLPSIPEGENYLWHTNRKNGLNLFGWRTRYWGFLLKLAKKRPSWTIQAQPGPAIGPFHWSNRRLSVEETARLQTFPKGIKFVGNRVSVQRQLGNAVPSLLAEVLAREVARQFFGSRYRDELQLAVRKSRAIPPPESVGPVPQKFLDMVGDHPDHPGQRRRSRARVR